MNKLEIKNLLISMKTSNNENTINELLSKIDLLTEEKLDSMVKQVGDNEESIKKYFDSKLKENELKNQNKEGNENKEFKPINDMFTFGIKNKTIHLHLPGSLKSMIDKSGWNNTMDVVNLKLLDAIDKINDLRNAGDVRFIEQDKIYMISPILLSKERKFLDDLDFETHHYKKAELQNEEFVNNNQEAKLATNIFGKDQNIGSAIIGFDVINSKEWQDKKETKIIEIKNRQKNNEREER